MANFHWVIQVAFEKMYSLKEILTQANRDSTQHIFHNVI